MINGGGGTHPIFSGCVGTISKFNEFELKLELELLLSHVFKFKFKFKFKFTLMVSEHTVYSSVIIHF